MQQNIHFKVPLLCRPDWIIMGYLLNEIHDTNAFTVQLCGAILPYYILLCMILKKCLGICLTLLSRNNQMWARKRVK